MKLPTPNKKAIFGYTLIELLVVTSIMALLFVVGMAAYNQFNRTQILQQTSLDLKNNLRLAQNKALSGEKPGIGTNCYGKSLWGYQVVFLQDSYEIKVGCGEVYGQDFYRLIPQKKFNLPSSVRFKVVPPKTVPDPIFFKGLGQGLDQSATITLTGFGLEKTVTVSQTGEIK